MIHGDDPSSSNGPESRPQDNPKPSNPPKLEYELVSIDELDPPPRTAGGARIGKLFSQLTPESIAELSDILWTCDQRPSLSYLGYRLANSLSPSLAPLACEVMRRKSFHCTRELLAGLAQRDYCHFISGEAPVVAGPEFAEFRRLIADLVVSPECHFVERDWARHSSEIVSLTTYPITILRRSAEKETDSVLLKAATGGGLDQFMNRRALDLLTLRELSDPVHRVLPADGMSEIARATGSLLRDPFNIAHLYALLDLWASKEENLPSGGECVIRDMLIERWESFKASKDEIRVDQTPAILSDMRLLRHFPDPLSALCLKEAAEHAHAGIRILARLALEGPSERALADLRLCLRSTENFADRLAASRVFGHYISPDVDHNLIPILDEYVQGLWGSKSESEDGERPVLAERVVILQALVRRFYSERSDSPFLKPIFESIQGRNGAMINLAVNTFVQATQMGRIPPPQFYDDPSALASLRSTLDLLGRGMSKEQRGEGPTLVEAMEELFVYRGPAAYGFELMASDVSPSREVQGGEPPPAQ